MGEKNEIKELEIQGRTAKEEVLYAKYKQTRKANSDP